MRRAHRKCFWASRVFLPDAAIKKLLRPNKMYGGCFSLIAIKRRLTKKKSSFYILWYTSVVPTFVIIFHGNRRYMASLDQFFVIHFSSIGCSFGDRLQYVGCNTFFLIRNHHFINSAVGLIHGEQIQMYGNCWGFHVGRTDGLSEEVVMRW